jgi:hypothetical protein
MVTEDFSLELLATANVLAIDLNSTFVGVQTN